MSDPKDIPGRHVPRRADPVQPDLPGSGNASGTGTGTGTNTDGKTEAEASPAVRRGHDERADAGLKNVREGYGGPSTDDHDDDPSMAPNRPATDAQ